jgi:hypothetical protein
MSTRREQLQGKWLSTRGEGKGIPAETRDFSPFASGERENTRPTVTVREELFFDPVPLSGNGSLARDGNICRLFYRF